MNILVSYDWLKEYVDLKGLTPEQFAARVSLSGPGVERLYPQGRDLDKIVVGHVLNVDKHPNADKLRIAVVDLGNSKATIVCGGSNLEKDQWVVVAKVGSNVRWHGEGELVELVPAEIRGVKSEGMICAANEIGLFDAFPHQEREILDLGKALPGMKLKPGTPLADALGLSGDTLMDIEVTSNRPDAFSLLGIAREAATILNKKLEWKPAVVRKPKIAKNKNLQVMVSDKKLCPRYMAAKIEGVTVGQSPWWMKRRLLSAGIRPINTAVDITNFVMLELGQPMHVFDAEKLAGNKLNVRKAKAGETMQALDGKTYKLHEDALVIADAEHPQAVAGVMGAETSAVTIGTTSIVLEAASFDPVSIRRTARKLNLYSDAQLRFEKGLSTQALPDAMARAIELITELCGGELTTLQDVQTAKYKAPSYSISFAKIDELIGVPIKKTDAASTLKRLGFAVKTDAKKLTATVPWWRDHDIESGRDLVEEIARVYGYANLPSVFPAGVSKRKTDRELILEQKTRDLVCGAGYTEAFTYSFISKQIAERAGFDTKSMLKLSNPLSADFEFMRTSLLPSMLDVMAENQDRFRDQHLFEIAHAYYTKDKGLPNEQLEMAVGVMGDRAWKEARGLVEHTFDGLGVRNIAWKPLATDPFWHPGRTAQAFDGDRLLATVGEIHPNLASKYKFDGRVALAHVPLENVFDSASDAKLYTPIPTYPVSKRDAAFVVSRDIHVQDMTAALMRASKLIRHVEWFDTYRGKGLPEDKKSVAFHFFIGSDEKTLETSDVDQVMDLVMKEAKNIFNAQPRI
ncbi:phenylalanine--tRNA ligase subunit beta [Candidatus Uhrbacteria bacterium]|nr:phenylalanine--tRNA ligase subunit beta [Candidatus Uhrbacteria bacterium]